MTSVQKHISWNGGPIASLIVIAILGAGGPNALCRDDEETLAPDRVAYIKSLRPGDTTKVGEKDQKNVLASRDYLTHLRLVELLAATDSEGIVELISKDRVKKLSGGDTARVIKVGKDWVEARLSSGDSKGQAVYVHWTWIFKP